MTEFGNFLDEVSNTAFETNTTATGAVTIQQSARNNLRKKGVAALKADLEALYSEKFDVLETKDGIVLVAENEPGGWTFSWELKSTIKSIDYDPFIEANNWDEECAIKEQKKAEREELKKNKIETIKAKREAKLAEMERKQQLTE